MMGSFCFDTLPSVGLCDLMMRNAYKLTTTCGQYIFVSWLGYKQNIYNFCFLLNL